jgi:hypothetical protein
MRKKAESSRMSETKRALKIPDECFLFEEWSVAEGRRREMVKNVSYIVTYFVLYF